MTTGSLAFKSFCSKTLLHDISHGGKRVKKWVCHAEEVILKQDLIPSLNSFEKIVLFNRIYEF